MKILLLPLLFPFVFASACSFDINIGDDAIVGSGVERTDDYTFDTELDAVSVGEIVDVTIVIDATAEASSLTLTGDDNVLDELEVETNGSTLVIGTDRYLNFRVRERPRAELVMPAIREIDTGGAANVTVDDLGATDTLRISSGGGSTVSTNGDLIDLEIDASGGAIIRHRGEVTTVAVDASGGSRVEVVDPIGTATVDASGGATVRVNTARISGSLSGGSRAIVPGTASVVDVDTSGGSRVETDDMG